MPRNMGEFGSSQWLETFKDNRRRFLSVEQETVDGEGLVPTEEILVVRQDRGRYQLWLRRDDQIRVYPTAQIRGVTDLLASKPTLWQNAALRVSYGSPIIGRAPVYGVPFSRAVDLALSKGFMKCQYYLPTPAHGSITAKLLLHIHRRKDSLLQLQAWQCPEGSLEICYVHALSPDFRTEVTHLDGALILFDKVELNALFAQGRKYKGRQYTKHFRVDGQIPMQDGIRLIRCFFPVEELVDEALGYATT